MKVKRGEIYLADLSDGPGSEQKKVRPVLIIQNNLGNKYSPPTIVACLSSKTVTKANIPTHYHLPEIDGLRYISMVLCEQIRVIDKNRLMRKLAKLSKSDMYAINIRLRISLDMSRSKKGIKVTP